MVRVEKIDADNPDLRLLREAADLVLKGEVIVCPTDTGYAFAANALDEKAVTKVFNLKGRAYSNPIHMAVSSTAEAEKYAYLNKAARHLAHTFLPGAITLVLPKKEIVPSLLVAGRDTVGIRIPDNKVILALAAMTNLPLTATSANISGRATPYTVQEVVEQLGDLIRQVALALDQGPLFPTGTSTIVDLSVKPPQILRHGRITEQEILKTLYLACDKRKKPKQSP